MSAGQSGPMILAIGTRDDFLHIYHNDQELIADNDIGAGPGELSGPIEFFDSDGYRLAGIYDRRWHLLRLTPTTEPPNPAAVARRVRNVVDHLRSYLSRHPEEAALYGMTVDEVLECFPRLCDSAELEDSLLALAAHHSGRAVGAAHLVDDDQPGWHNAMHRMGWKHD